MNFNSSGGPEYAQHPSEMNGTPNSLRTIAIKIHSALRVPKSYAWCETIRRALLFFFSHLLAAQRIPQSWLMIGLGLGLGSIIPGQEDRRSSEINLCSTALSAPCADAWHFAFTSRGGHYKNHFHFRAGVRVRGDLRTGRVPK